MACRLFNNRLLSTGPLRTSFKEIESKCNQETFIEENAMSGILSMGQMIISIAGQSNAF